MMKTPKQNRKEGGVLPLVMIMVLVMSVLGLGLMKQASYDAVETSRVLIRAHAFWLAEAGLQEFRALVSQPENRTRLDNVGLVGVGIITGTLPNGGSYSVDIVEDAANAGRTKKEYTVTSVGRTSGGEVSRVSIRAEAKLWTENVYSSHIEGNIWFSNDDVIGEEGKVSGTLRSNGQFNINGSPDIWAAAISAESTVNYNDARDGNLADPTVFRNGLELGAIPLDFGSQNFEQIEASAGLILTGNYAIEFDNNMFYLTDKGSGIVTTNFISGIAGAVNRRIIYVTGFVEVEGNVGEAVSVAAEGALFITEDIVYTSSLGQLPVDSDYVADSGEMLGLFSETKVEISEGWNIGDINIHASILVTQDGNGGFGAAWDGYWNYGYSSPYGHLNLYGSLNQYRRRAVGLVSGNGYTKNYLYNPELLNNPPPGTPYSVFKITQWEQL